MLPRTIWATEAAAPVAPAPLPVLTGLIRPFRSVSFYTELTVPLNHIRQNVEYVTRMVLATIHGIHTMLGMERVYSFDSTAKTIRSIMAFIHYSTHVNDSEVTITS